MTNLMRGRWAAMAAAVLLSTINYQLSTARAQTTNAPGLAPVSGAASTVTRFPIIVGTNGAVLSPTQYLGMYLMTPSTNTIAISNVVRDVITAMGGLTTTLGLGNATLKFSKGFLTNSTITAWDSAALAFLGAASITDSTISNAINNFVVTAKTPTGNWPSGFWGSFPAIYPFVGGNSTAHSKNLKGSSFTITWHGTVTHSSTGITGNGTDGWGDTGLNLSTVGTYTQNSASMLVYCGTQTPTDTGRFIGGEQFSGSTIKSALMRANPNFAVEGFNSATASSGQALSDFRGLLGVTRTNSTAFTLILPSGLGGQVTDTSSGLPNVTVGLLARNEDIPQAENFSNANLRFAMIGAGMSGAQFSEVQTAIATFEAALSRTAP